MNPWKHVYKNRPSYLPKGMMKDFPYFISEYIGKEQLLDKVHVKDFSLISIIKLLECTTREAVYYHKLFYISGIRHKRTFGTYLNFCKHFKLIEGKKHDEDHEQKVFYKTTEKGKMLVGLFKEAIL